MQKQSNHAKKGLLASGASMVGNNKRYIFWFFILNLTLGSFATAAFRNQAHSILDNSLYSGRLVHGFDMAAFVELMMRPEFGPTKAATMSAFYFIFLFFVGTALFLPGVFQGFAATYRLQREEFFRACGRNLWRFVRLLIVSGIVLGIAAGILFGAQGALVKKAGESTNELLPFEINLLMLTIIFLIMSTVRIWFDLAEADVVLSDQNAVRKSLGKGWRSMLRGWGSLLGSYVLTTIIAGAILYIGLWVWIKLVAPESILGAFFVSQVTLLLLLIPRFWQRGIAVTYWQQRMAEPILVVEPAAVIAAPAPGTSEPVVAPVIPTGATETPTA